MARTTKENPVEKKILDTFSEVAGSIGYSPLHGRIIGMLLVNGGPMSLQELAKKTGYSTSMVSLSLDLLDVLGVVRRVKKTADRRLYIELSGDLLECLKKAFVMRLGKSIKGSLEGFSRIKEATKGDKSALRTMEILEKEIKRLETYINLLSKIKLP